MQFQTPILFLIFNRPDTTKKVFGKIREIKPKYLYIAADGPRSERENEKTELTRKIAANIDWACEIKTLFRKENLGCKIAVSTAIDWFFENVQQGIILEDDCVPNISFFRFCEALLEKYKDNDEIMQINGTNILGKTKINSSYFFSHYFLPWGWATWKRAWEKYDLDMKGLDNFQLNTSKFIFNCENERQYWINTLEYVKNNDIDTWDHQWMYSCWRLQAKCVTPAINLISNIGYREDATHTKKENQILEKQKTYNINIIKHTDNIVLERKLDQKIYKKAFYKKNNLEKINRLKNSFKKFTSKAIRIFSYELGFVSNNIKSLKYISSKFENSTKGNFVKISHPYKIYNTKIDDYSYISNNSNIWNTKIGKFCSIGPNFNCGLGIHSTSGVSTSPMFYSTIKQNGITLSKKNKIEERKQIIIGNDVYIGINVTIIDGLKIGNGAIMAAGSVVTKDIPPYAIVGGVPAKIIKYRFEKDIIINLEKTKWWDWSLDELKLVEQNFLNVEKFLLEINK